MRNILSVEKIEKYYGNKENVTKAIDNINFKVDEGKFVGIMGPSGSGKTTLLNCISTIDNVTTGKILINDSDITILKSKALDKFRQNELGFIFQDFNLLDTLTAYENIALALTIKGEKSSEIDEKIKAVAQYLENVIYSDKSREQNNKKYSEIHENLLSHKYKDLSISNMDAYSKDGIYSRSKGGTTAVPFIGIYLGIIFLLTSMAVLALQQLSEASDSIERYKALKRIGANKKMIDKTIFIQTLIYFSLPVLLALIHSIIGVTVVNDELSKFNQTDIRFSALITALLFIVVYGGYFCTTYTGYKNIVKNNI